MVNLLLTVEACVSRGALAEVAPIRVVGASAAVGAGPVGTRHGAQLAVVAIKTVRTSAGIRVLQILWGTRRDIRIKQLLELCPRGGRGFWLQARGGNNTRCSCNRVSLFCDNTGRQSGTHGATSSVAAGVSSTFIDLDLTAGPSEARPAGTGVAALTGVATSGSIHAGLVVSAVVEIWKDTAAHVD